MRRTRAGERRADRLRRRDCFFAHGYGCHRNCHSTASFFSCGINALTSIDQQRMLLYIVLPLTQNIKTLLVFLHLLRVQ